MSNTYWSDTDQYRRILEILDAYWLSEKNELKVRVRMDFIHADGSTQSKCIMWRNPDLPMTAREEERFASEPRLLSIADIPRDPAEIYEHEQKFWDM